MNLTDIERFLDDYRTAGGVNFREAAERMALARAEFQQSGKGWRSRFREWAHDNSVSDTERCTMLRVVDTLPEDFGRDLPMGMQRAVSEAWGSADEGELLHDAVTLSISDFRALRLVSFPKPPKRLTCPECGYRDLASEFSGDRDE